MGGIPLAVTVRDAQPGDRETIVQFNTALATESEGKTLDPDVLRLGVEAALDHPDRLHYWVAEIDGRIIGQAAVTREWSDWRNGWLWWIQSVYVRPEARRRGVFRTLYEHVYQAALRESGVIGLRLYMEHNNQAARQTYLRLGMEEAGYVVFQKYPL